MNTTELFEEPPLPDEIEITEEEMAMIIRRRRLVSQDVDGAIELLNAEIDMVRDNLPSTDEDAHDVFAVIVSRLRALSKRRKG